MNILSKMNYSFIIIHFEILFIINDNLEAQAKLYFNSTFCDLVQFSESNIEETKYGPCPQGWHYANLGDFCDANIGNLAKLDNHLTLQYLDTGSITQNYIDTVQMLDTTKDEIPSRAKRKVYDGDIVYSTVRPNLKHYGLIYDPPCNFIASTGFAVLHNNNHGVSNELLYMWLTKESILEFLQAIAENSVSTYPSLNVNDLLEIKVLIPDNVTLEKTNDFLRVVYASIAENNKQIKLLQDSKALLLPRLLSSR